MKYRIGDTVMVMTGKDRGKTGSIQKISGDRVLVEGMNTCIKHKKGGAGQPGERFEMSAPIHISNIQIIDPKGGKPSRVSYIFDESGNKVRVAQQSKSSLLNGDSRKTAAPKPKKTTSKKKTS